MAKLAWNNYGNNPVQFIRHLHQMHMDTLTGIDLKGERNAIIYKPGSRYWSSTTLPWMAFGYNVEVTPLQTITLYNAIANNGKMMRPYLVSAIKEHGSFIKEIEPKVIDEKICSESTLQQLKECLEGVCIEGTAKDVFKTAVYKVAGKTGTALVANGNKGYADEIFQSSFAGYFPANNPQYTILVVIKNKPHALNHYGASVAGPVFKEIADRLYLNYVHQTNTAVASMPAKDSVYFNYVGLKDDVKHVMKTMQLHFSDSSSLTDDWVNINSNNGAVGLFNRKMIPNTMPLLKGMGLKDVVYLCENLGLKINVKGRGRVEDQSIAAGTSIAKGQVINISLN
jgi:cell division protein FtsI (penicillin-binding protein 3)